MLVITRRYFSPWPSGRAFFSLCIRPKAVRPSICSSDTGPVSFSARRSILREKVRGAGRTSRKKNEEKASEKVREEVNYVYMCVYMYVYIYIYIIALKYWISALHLEVNYTEISDTKYQQKMKKDQINRRALLATKACQGTIGA